jgi:hypothetical protein
MEFDESTRDAGAIRSPCNATPCEAAAGPITSDGKAVRTLLSSIVSEVLEAGLIATNPVRNLSRMKGRKKEKPKPVVLVDIPARRGASGRKC